MVFRGRPSRGCACCRKAGVKCDQQRPACARCRRLYQNCEGYRNIDDLIFLNETAKISTDGRASPGGKKTGVSALSTITLDSTGRDGIVWCFYHATMATLTRQDHPYHLHSALPSMYYNSSRDSVLVLAVQAVSHATGYRMGISKATTARRLYSIAVAALSQSLQDPVKVRDEKTLYAALLLCGYETIACESENLQGWAAHVKGIAALLACHSEASTQTKFATRMHRFARRSVFLYQLQSGTSLMLESISSDSPENEVDNDADRLFGLMSQLSDIRLHWKVDDNLRCDVDALLEACHLLERDFLDWKASLPPSWMYSARHLLSTMGTANKADIYMPPEIHKYPNTFIARIWNLYRTCHIILCVTVARLQETQGGHTPTWDLTAESVTDRAIVKGLVDDICASVQFLVGGPEAHQPSTSTSKRDKVSNTRSGSQNGKFSLLWPLHVGSARQLVGRAQRKWMRGQILLLAQSGDVPLAAHVYSQECQILAGGQETLFFDCV